MLIVANEDPVAVSVETERDAVAVQQAAEQAEIAASVFGEEELGDGNFASGIVEKSQQGDLRIALFQPGMKAGVERAEAFSPLERVPDGAGDERASVVCGASQSPRYGEGDGEFHGQQKSLRLHGASRKGGDR